MTYFRLFKSLSFNRFKPRYYSGKKVKTDHHDETSIERIRNIGVIAHVDAGKTTTTERMLYYAGFTTNVGNVDDGNTVMDYMAQERERGITITSAAITFNWKEHRFNLIDTPGHIDFSFEVERSLRVLDGAITIIDASAGYIYRGVEPQTLTVWNQSNKYKIPRIVYVNKMDKSGANYEKCLKSIETKLKTVPIPVQIPLGVEKDLVGVIDLINMRKLVWDRRRSSDDFGKSFKVEPLVETSDSAETLAYARQMRVRMLERLAQANERFAETCLDRYDMNFARVTDHVLVESHLRRSCIECRAAPILCGSSLRNTAVQPLMDAVVKYLPHPNELEKNRQFAAHYGDGGLVAVCFKTLHDHQKSRKRVNSATEIANLQTDAASVLNRAKSEEMEDDILSFVRVYNGELQARTKVYNPNRDVKENCEKIYIPYSNQLKSVHRISAGNIGVINGLSKTMTGDFLVTSKHAYESAVKSKQSKSGVDDSSSMLDPIDIPPPVYFCTVEPQNEQEEKRLKLALECLAREDASLRVNFDDEDNQGQTVMQGLGELQFDIVRDRIKREYKLNAYFGPLNIAYKEMPTRIIDEHFALRKELPGDKKIAADIGIQVRPTLNDYTFRSVRIEKYTLENGLADLTHEVRHAVNHGVQSALNRGVLLRYPVVNVDVYLTKLICSSNIGLPYVSSAAFTCTLNALKNADSIVIQPVMRLEIKVPREYASRVHSDLNRRNCISLAMSESAEDKLVIFEAIVPLSKLNSYSSEFRKLSSGNGTFAIEFDSYKELTQREFDELLKKKQFKI